MAFKFCFYSLSSTDRYIDCVNCLCACACCLFFFNHGLVAAVSIFWGVLIFRHHLLILLLSAFFLRLGTWKFLPFFCPALFGGLDFNEVLRSSPPHVSMVLPLLCLRVFLQARKGSSFGIFFIIEALKSFSLCLQADDS